MFAGKNLQMTQKKASCSDLIQKKKKKKKKNDAVC